VGPRAIPNGASAPVADVKTPAVDFPGEKVALWKYACAAPDPMFTGLLNPKEIDPEGFSV